MRSVFQRALRCLVVTFLSGAFLAAQEVPRPAPAFGTASYAIRTIHGTSFRPIQSDTTYSQHSGTTHLFRTGGQLYFDYALSDLPAGALLTGIELEFCDTNPAASVNASLQFRTAGGVNGHVDPSLDSGDGAMPGCGFLGSSGNLAADGEFVDNFEKSYWVRVTLEGTDSSTSLGAVRVYYQLQVSPPPAVATFADVPTSHPFFQFVEALAASGITAGCGSGNFCPDAPLTRKQMAAFLSIALGLHFPY